MRSRCALAFVLAVSLGYLQARPVFAEDSDPHTVTLQLYGALTPGAAGYGSDSHGEMWAYGGAVQWGLAEHWAVSVDASRFSEPGSSVAPMVAAMTYRPFTSAKIRPYLEGGAGLYRLESHSFLRRTLGSSGNPRDYFPRPGGTTGPSAWRSAVGGFLGAGGEAMLSSRVGLGLDLRLHNWYQRDPDATDGASRGTTPWSGMLSLRSGLSYRF